MRTPGGSQGVGREGGREGEGGGGEERGEREMGNIELI